MYDVAANTMVDTSLHTPLLDSEYEPLPEDIADLVLELEEDPTMDLNHIQLFPLHVQRPTRGRSGRNPPAWVTLSEDGNEDEQNGTADEPKGAVKTNPKQGDTENSSDDPATDEEDEHSDDSGGNDQTIVNLLKPKTNYIKNAWLNQSIFNFPDRPINAISFYQENLTSSHFVNSILQDGYKFKVAPSCPRFHFKTNKSRLMTTIINVLVKNKVLIFSKNQPFSTFPMRVIRKGSTLDVRPIYDLGPFTEYLSPPPFKLPSVKTLIVKMMDGNVWTAKVDITDAFLHIPVHPRFSNYLGIKYNNEYYKFTRLPFGLAYGSFVCQRVYTQILCDLGISKFLIYLDDILFYGSKNEVAHSIKLVLSGFSKYNIPLNYKKSVLFPVQNILYLGVRFDFQKATISLAKARRIQLYKLIDWVRSKQVVGTKTAQRIRGTLLYYVSALGWPIFPVAHWSLADMAFYYKSFICNKHIRYLPLHSDSATMFTDAIPGRIGWIDCKGKGSSQSLKSPLLIHLAEGLALVRAVADHVNRYPTLKRLLIHCDNTVVLYNLNRLNSPCFLNQVIIHLFYSLVRKHSLYVRIVYIPSNDNPADRWSRMITNASASHA
ncbi:Protein P [Nymphon striatum]|nr:Protein P [Nymphon striatum]